MTLAVGPLRVHETVKACTGCSNGTQYRSQQLTNLAPHGCTFGYDVMVHIGKALFLACRDEESVQAELMERGVCISRGEIGFLAKKFIVYLAIAHKQAQRTIIRHMRRHGGYILHLDGTSTGDSPHLFSALDGLNELVLDNVKISAESCNERIPFLQEIRHAYGMPIAMVHDMSAAIIKAIDVVFPGVPDFVCHFHFLRDAGKDLLAEDYECIRKRLRKHGIQKFIRDHMAMFRAQAEEHTDVADFILDDQSIPKPHSNDDPTPFTVLLYLQLAWTIDGKHQGGGYGFPFDRTYLTFYQRIVDSYRIIESLNKNLPCHLHQRKRLGKIWKKLRDIVNDRNLTQAARRLQEKTIVFDRLRKAMRITLETQKNGLNEQGDVQMGLIREQLNIFRKNLAETLVHSEPAYQSLLVQLDKYWDKLLADPITRKTDNGRLITIYPQRTNNILEQFFRDFRKSHRKRTGCDSIAKLLKTMNPQTPLARNLKDQKYVEMIRGDAATLEERFARIDHALVTRKTREVADQNRSLSPRFRNAIRKKQLPRKIATLVEICIENNHRLSP